MNFINIHGCRDENNSKILNSFTLRNITTKNETVQEFVFSCFSWNNRSRNVKEYFVSQEYNSAWNWNSRIRIIFAHNEKKETVVIAMAEPPAELSTDFNSLDKDQLKDGLSRYHNLLAKSYLLLYEIDYPIIYYLFIR